MVTDICGRMNLVSDDAIARVGQELNDHYRRVTATVGLEPLRYVTRTAQTQLTSDTVTFTGIEKIDRVFERDADGVIHTLKPVPVAQLRQSRELQGNRYCYCILHQVADSITIQLPGLALAITDLYADGWSTLADMTGSDKPAIPESFHNIIVNNTLGDECLRKEKTELADRFYAMADTGLKELRFHIADAPPIDWRQGDHVIGNEGGGNQGGAGGSVITGLIVFDRDPGAPFQVTPGSAKVDNLDADKLDGQQGTDYHDAAQLTGTIDPSRLPPIPPAVPLPHHVSHETGGTDAITALDASVITTGIIDPSHLPILVPTLGASTLLGRNSGSAGAAEQITLGSGLQMLGTTLTAPAVNRSTFQFDYSNALTEPPTSNQVRLNAAFPYTTVSKLWVRVLTSDGIDATLPLSLITAGTVVYLQDKNDATLYVVVETTADALVKSGYVELSVIWKKNGGALLNNQAVLLTIGTGGGSVDEVLVGTDTPTDPGTELWYDTDAVPAASGAIGIVSRGVTLAGTITTGLKGIVRVPFNATVLGWAVMADVATTITFDVAANAPVTYPPSTSIVASAPPKLTAQGFNSDVALAGWTTTLNAGDLLAFRVSAITGTPAFVTLQLDLGAR